MSTEPWERSAAIGAVVSVAMMAIAIAFMFNVATGDAGYLNRQAAQTMVAAGVLVTLAAGFFLPWIAAVRAALGRAEDEPAGLSSLAAYSGTVWLILTLAATAVGTAFSATVVSRDDFRGDEDLATVLTTGSHWLAGMAVAGSVVMAAAVSRIAFRDTTLPRWFAWWSMVAAIAQVIGLLTWPVAAAITLIWMLTFALLMQRG
jgi:hypothetical protein